MELVLIISVAWLIVSVCLGLILGAVLRGRARRQALRSM